MITRMSKIAELEPRKVTSVTPHDGGFEVVLECGHVSYWPVDPPHEYARCSQCLDAVIERLRKKEGFRAL